MDSSSCDLTSLENTYSQFRLINGLLSGWRRLYLKHLREVLSSTSDATLLDIGFGGGDIAIQISKWAKKDNLNLKITAIETDPRSLDYIKKLSPDETSDINFRFASLEEVIKENRKFDIVISNHVLHHLPDEYLKSFLEQSQSIARRIVIHNDLERSRLALYLFTFSRFFFKNSFITHDGLISIQRSFRQAELNEIIGSSWQVKKFLPFRLITMFQNEM